MKVPLPHTGLKVVYIFFHASIGSGKADIAPTVGSISFAGPVPRPQRGIPCGPSQRTPASRGQLRSANANVGEPK